MNPALRFAGVVGRTGALAGLLVLELAVFASLSLGYAAPAALLDASRTFAEAGLLVCGMTLVVISRGLLQAGRLGALAFTAKDELLLVPPLVFTRDNLDRFDF